MKKLSVLVLLIAILAIVCVARCAEIPYLTGRVNDNAQILTEDARQLLSEKLKEHEDRTSNQVVVLTIASLQGENIEDYTNKVFIEWGLGQKDKDNGILILVVPDERRLRIEVGYGLEPTITDLLAGRIIREVMTPRFREGDYDGGITEGTLAIISVLEGHEPLEAAEFNEESDSSSLSGFSDLESHGLPWGVRILLGAFIFGIIGLFTVVGLFTPGFGWFLYIFLIPFWATFPIIVIGLKATLVVFFIYLIGYPSAKLYMRSTPWYNKVKNDLKTKGRASIGGFSFSSGGSGGSWSSSSSSGFSGGGGSSGGGGASGGW
jgi:uncharacterized protein